MPALDLEQTYLSLDGQGQVRTHPAAGFWESVDENPTLLGTLVSAFPNTEDWPQWEMHPAGEEVLVLVEGRMILILDEPGGERRVEMTPGSTCIVPRGIWHRALVPEAGSLLTLTYGAGTQHRPL
ncbi:cupin domain-containing protein [uncultured Phenylobacterium sp.]|uniref:cupin domain-containing protein n=1 Tax=uncultured Phenylobacterium sp. TaxID=349273 RepID=UPI0025CC4B6D|nr:cupin domain-containing protein [uncultured Phenylobacterium sp.]